MSHRLLHVQGEQERTPPDTNSTIFASRYYVSVGKYRQAVYERSVTRQRVYCVTFVSPNTNFAVGRQPGLDRTYISLTCRSNTMQNQCRE